VRLLSMNRIAARSRRIEVALGAEQLAAVAGA
jgi:hypothetical protein